MLSMFKTCGGAVHEALHLVCRNAEHHKPGHGDDGL